ncbi:MAG: ABC transporter permease [Lachnospira sp.]|nr:ABC transporter permease [Lachnospira sp.]
MNNKRYFSVNMFWQTFKQLRAIGIVATVLMVFFNIVTVWFGAIGAEAMIKMYADNPNYRFTPEVVSVTMMHEPLFLMLWVFTPLLALNAWKFLNKRNTSDFYHSLPYTRVCLFVSKTVAAIAWMLFTLVVVYVGTAITYVLCKKYYVVDHVTLFRMFLAVFIAGLLVFAAISMACAVTGNGFNNLVVSLIILFVPRFMITLTTSAISMMTYIVSETKALSFINDTQNMVTSLVFNTFMYFGSSTQDIILSVEANIYTLVLAIVYMVLALVLFVRRKSETAGKASDGKGIDFVSKFIVAGLISSVGTMSAVVDTYGYSDISDLEKMSYIYAVVACFFAAAIAVVLYEFFASRHSFKFKRCLVPIGCGWAFALLMIVVLNVSADNILSYKPERADMDYVIISDMDENDYYYDNMEYFNSISKKTKIKDEKILDIVSEALKYNIEMVEKDRYDEFYRYSHENYYDADTGMSGKELSYVGYQVYIKDGAVGRYRTIYFTSEQEKAIVNNMQNIKEYKDAFYDLPAYDKASVEWYGYSDFGEENSRVLYETFLEELKGVSFEDYYGLIKGDSGYAESVSLGINFSRGGYTYSAELELSKKVFPKTVNKYYQINNKEALKDTKAMDGLKAALRKVIDGKFNPEDKGKEEYLDACVLYTDDSIITVDEYVAGERDNVRTVLYPELLKAVESGKEQDFLANDKMLVRVSYSNADDMHNWYFVNYFVTIDKNLDIDWKELFEDYGYGVIIEYD